MGASSHSVRAPHVLTRHLERVVCDYCGADDTTHLDVLSRLRLPMHRLGAAALQLDGYEIEFVRCNVCGLAYMNPRLTEAAVETFYDTVYAATGANEAFHSEQQARTRYVLDTAAQHLSANSPRILDIGCGAGQLLLGAQARGWDVAGTELSAVAAQQATETLGMTVFHGDFREMNAGMFDVVTMMSVVEHLRAPVDFLAASAALLNPGGLLVFNVPNLASAEYHVARMTGQSWRGFIIEHLYYFNPSWLRRILTELGLDVVVMTSWNPDAALPNPVRDVRSLLSPQMQAETAPTPTETDSATPSPTRDPPLSLTGRVLRQANNYLLDTVGLLSAGKNSQRGNALFVWAKRTV